MHRTAWFMLWLLLISSGLVVARSLAPARPAAAGGARTELRLFETVTTKGKGLAATTGGPLKVIPGSEAEAQAYYNDVRKALVGFSKPTLQESRIGDMLVYYGFPALLASDLERLDSAVIMDFEQLRKQVSNGAEFEAAYRGQPLRADEILATRFFAPKIINVRDPQVNGVPQGGFGWRKVLRFRARDGSAARGAGLNHFYLLFNFASQEPTFPVGTHAGQIQAILVPIYPHGGRHRDVYFLVFESLGGTNPERVGTFLVATFDLAGVVPDDRYYIPRSCGQCHGTTASDQKAAKVNYLDTDHWIDRTGDDFRKVKPADVLVDGTASYGTFRKLNTEIEQQNSAVVGSGPPFALLAARKWLELHPAGSGDQHVPPLNRGFGADPVWKAGVVPDQELLPVLNQYCFRCHSSIAYHVFDRKAVVARKASIAARVRSGNMPQDRKLDGDTKNKLLALIDQLK
ncbi:MAG TPA: hypothetical protein VKY89_11515 [Thermoanaerobaculia bacterium]|nr:hypothetical protein [Thermoanaerobaculia bacterium]